jgi:hypothetical protein
MGPIGDMAPRRTGRQSVGRNTTWHWTCVIALQITDQSSRQRGHPTSTNPQLSKNNQIEKGENWSRVPDECLTPRRTGRQSQYNLTLNLLHCTANYRPVLSSKRALQDNKPELSKETQGKRKIGRGSQMGAWHQDGLADWRCRLLYQTSVRNAALQATVIARTVRMGAAIQQ